MTQNSPQDDPTPAGERIAKVLSRAGVASRRDAERMIAEGRVRVNGKPIDSPALNVLPADRISVDGALVGAPEPPRLWLYHKPAGLVTTERDEKDRPTVFAALPEDMPRVMSVGRLDLNSEGLLVLTNDGEIKRRLELPSTGWLRRYRVRINGSVSEAKLDELRAGITVEGLRYQPMTVTFDRQQGANAWLTVSLREGKNREIRRAMEAIGVAVNRLIRVSYGPFQLGNLAPGEVEELKARVVRDQLGLEARPVPARRGPAGPASGSRAPVKGGSAAARGTAGSPADPGAARRSAATGGGKSDRAATGGARSDRAAPGDSGAGRAAAGGGRTGRAAAGGGTTGRAAAGGSTADRGGKAPAARRADESPRGGKGGGRGTGPAEGGPSSGRGGPKGPQPAGGARSAGGGRQTPGAGPQRPGKGPGKGSGKGPGKGPGDGGRREPGGGDKNR